MPVKALKVKNPTRKTNLAGFSFEAAGGKSAANTPFCQKVRTVTPIRFVSKLRFLFGGDGGS